MNSRDKHSTSNKPLYYRTICFKSEYSENEFNRRSNKIFWQGKTEDQSAQAWPRKSIRNWKQLPLFLNRKTRILVAPDAAFNRIGSTISYFRDSELFSRPTMLPSPSGGFRPPASTLNYFITPSLLFPELNARYAEF